MLSIRNNPGLKGLSIFYPNIVYSTIGEKKISMDMIIPQTTEDSDSRFPLIVFIQGSAWHCPDTGYEIPQLAQFAADGFAVATIRHRNIAEGDPAPAFLQDAKTAIRFLRANAAEYHIDDSRVYAFGTSSGGNTALLLGLTGDMEKYKTDEYAGYSDSVAGVSECFGPTDLVEMLRSRTDEPEDSPRIQLVKAFCGGSIDESLMADMSPYYYLKEGKSYVPFMIAHGDSDRVVDFSQSEKFAEKLKECGADVCLVKVLGADHEGSFWSQEIIDTFRNFFRRLAGE